MRGSLARLESRVHQLNRRPGFAGWTARLALRGRHCAEATHALRHAARAAISRRLRTYQTLRLQLEQFDLRRRFGRHAHAPRRRRWRVAVGCGRSRHHRAQTRFHTGAARLESLSPLAVLGRGYAVVWDASRTRVPSGGPSELKPGDAVRVTLSARRDLRMRRR